MRRLSSAERADDIESMTVEELRAELARRPRSFNLSVDSPPVPIEAPSSVVAARRAAGRTLTVVAVDAVGVTYTITASEFTVQAVEP